MQEVKIVDYNAQYRSAFKSLNKEWIEKYFQMEEADYKALDYPEKNIIDNGGYIKVALIDNIPVGVCALMKLAHPKYDFELAKMAVSPNHQGKKIGKLLAQSIIDLAKIKKAKYLYLESNTILTPAINLYKRMGFIEIENHSSPYKRSNISMELDLYR